MHTWDHDEVPTPCLAPESGEGFRVQGLAISALLHPCQHLRQGAGKKVLVVAFLVLCVK